MNLDWARLKAVVLESDDWGLCAWVPDEQAFRVLVDTPAWRGAAGRIYGRSTLESAGDVERLASTLLEFRGGDGFPPVWQANTIMAAPDYERLVPPSFEIEELPLVPLPETPRRWRRPGMWDQVGRAMDAGVWWPELHGLHHAPVAAWLRALRRGTADARRAHEQECMVCEAVQAGSEYDPSEPLAVRTRNIEHAIERFQALFGRLPGSLCPPDYRWDETLEQDAERLGVTTIQGKTEQESQWPAPLRRLLHRARWPDLRARRFYLPPRIAFEPRGGVAPAGGLGAIPVHQATRVAWGRGQPAIVSTHRVNYAHLDSAWSEAGRAALRDLLGRLAGDAAVFLTDAEVRSLVESGWSVRSIGDRGALLRFYGVPREPVRFAAPERVSRAVVCEGQTGVARIEVESGWVRAEVNPGEYLLEWRRE